MGEKPLASLRRFIKVESMTRQHRPRIASVLVATALAAGLLVPVAPWNITVASAAPCTPDNGSSAVNISSRLFNGSSLSSGSSQSSRQFTKDEDYIGSSNPPFLKGQPGGMPILKGHTEVTQLVTGPGSPDRTDRVFDVTGTDLGIAYDDQKGNTMLVLGDTMACNFAANNWRSNTILRSHDYNYRDDFSIHEGLGTNGYMTGGHATEFIPSLKVPGIEHTTIPTAGIAIGDTQYIDYMSVRNWNEPGHWVTNYAGTVRSNDGVHWTLVPESIRTNTDATAALNFLPGFRAGNQKAQMSAFVENNGFVYRFSTPSGRNGSAILGRAPIGEFPNEAAFEYLTPDGWTRDLAAATPVIDDQVSELSVAWNDHLHKFIAMYTDGRGLVIRTADALEGPWSEKTMVVDVDTIYDLYGGFMLPHQNGRDLYYVLTTWSNYNVMLMHTDLDALLAGRPDATWDDGLSYHGTATYK